MTRTTAAPRRRTASEAPQSDLANPQFTAPPPVQTADPASPPDQFVQITEVLRTTDAPAQPQAGPTPPPIRQGAPSAPAVAGWTYGQAITHVFSYDSPQGAWVFVNGPGWKRLSPASPHGVTQMITIATMATHDNLPVNFHEDAAGLIDQMYV